eukprot:1343897-Amorphochlora_amoeboformis.AAC.1
MQLLEPWRMNRTWLKQKLLLVVSRCLQSAMVSYRLIAGIEFLELVGSIRVCAGMRNKYGMG